MLMCDKNVHGSLMNAEEEREADKCTRFGPVLLLSVTEKT